MKKLHPKVLKGLGDFPWSPFYTNYNPWEQRFCIAPNGDFFRAIRKGTASIVTDHIDRFFNWWDFIKIRQGIEGRYYYYSNRLLAFGGVKIQLDSQPFDISKSLFIRDWCWAIFLIFYFCWLYQCVMDVKVISLVNIFRDFWIIWQA
jgi:hypothetical protein